MTPAGRQPRPAPARWQVNLDFRKIVCQAELPGLPDVRNGLIEPRATVNGLAETASPLPGYVCLTLGGISAAPLGKPGRSDLERILGGW